MPNALLFSRRANNIMPTPINASAIKNGVILIEDSDTNIPVTLVPSLAPNEKAQACRVVIAPISTMPKLITVVADDDCTTAVDNAPKP